MKSLLYIFLIAFAMNCGSANQNNQNTAEVASSENTESEEEEQQSDVLVGEIQKEDLQQAPHKGWYDPMYQSYESGAEALETIKKNINDYKIKVFMGTWCGDSKREIPKLYKLLELSDYDFEKLEMNGVRRDKTLPNDIQKDFDIHHVPTIIFYRNGEEAGRFVEYPQEELEDDIAKIVSGQEYQHSYE